MSQSNDLGNNYNSNNQFGAFGNLFLTARAPKGPTPESLVGTPAPQPNLFNVNPGRFTYTKYAADGPSSKTVLSNINGASVAGALANGGVMAPGYPGAPPQTQSYPIEVPKTDFTSLWSLISQLAPGNQGQMVVPQASTPGTSLSGVGGRGIMS